MLAALTAPIRSADRSPRYRFGRPPIKPRPHPPRTIGGICRRGRPFPRQPPSRCFSDRGRSMITYLMFKSAGATASCRSRSSGSMCIASTMTERPSRRTFELLVRTSWNISDWLTYDGYERLVEPYKLEYYVRKKDGRGLEYFWGWDTTGGRSGSVGIKQFICDKIQSVHSTAQRYQPRYNIEL
jgi:hypothetical protein